jgi:hypothetical protein
MVSSRNFPGPGLGQVAGLLASLAENTLSVDIKSYRGTTAGP